MMDIVCRTSNRMFVGLPLCERFLIIFVFSLLIRHVVGRDLDYMSLNKEFTINIIKAAHIINIFPSFLRS